MLKTITVSSAAIDKGQLTAELATATEDNTPEVTEEPVVEETTETTEE